MPNISYTDIMTNIWARESTTVEHGSNRKLKSAMGEQRRGPGQGTSTSSKTTDGPHVSPRGDHTTIKYVTGDQHRGETTWIHNGGTL